MVYRGAGAVYGFAVDAASSSSGGAAGAASGSSNRQRWQQQHGCKKKRGGGCIRTGMSAGFIAPSPWLIRQMLEKKVLAGECVSLLVSSKDVFI